VPRRFTFTTNLILFMSSSLKCRDPAIHFMEIEYTTVRGLPHSMQCAFDRGVISPQDGHILCPDPATSDSVSCFQRNSRTVNSTISRPQQILPALIKSEPSGRVLDRPSESFIRVRHRGVDRLATESLTQMVGPLTR
jgi:hypothetical protein